MFGTTKRMLLIRVILLCSTSIPFALAAQELPRVPIELGGTIGVQLGSPPQHLNLLLDTGSGSTWVTSRTALDIVTIAGSFNENESSTCKVDGRRWRTGYAAGLFVEGDLVGDSLTLAGLTIQDHLFGLCRSSRGFSMSHFSYSGAIGLGSRLRPAVDVVDPVQSMYRQRLIEREMFSIHLLRDAPSMNGTLVLGGLDEQFYQGEITYAPIGSRWTFSLDYAYSSLRSGFQLVSTLREAVLDSTSNIIQVPAEDMELVRRRSNARLDNKSNLYRFESCADAELEQDLVLQIRGRNFTIPGKDLVVELWERVAGTTEIRKHCYSAIFQGDNQWILGYPFLRNHYTVYDYKNNRIGVAEPRGSQITQ